MPRGSIETGMNQFHAPTPPAVVVAIFCCILILWLIATGLLRGHPPPGGPGPRPPAHLRRQNATENPGSGPRALPWRGDGGEDGGPGPEGGDGGSGDAADAYREEDLDALFAAVDRDE